MRTHMPMRYDASDEDPWLMAVRHPHGEPPRRADSIERCCGRTSIEPDSCAAASSATNSEREEPDEVEVEPVRPAELERDQHGGAERGDGDRVAAARDEGDGDARAQRRRAARRCGAGRS